MSNFKTYETYEKEQILKTVYLLVDLENEGYICDWEIRRQFNSWSAWYPYQNDSFLIGGSLIDTNKKTILNEIQRVEEEYEEWLRR